MASPLPALRRRAHFRLLPLHDRTEREIVPVGVAAVHGALDQVDLGEARANHFGAAVAGGVINHPDLKGATGWVGVDRREAVGQQIGAVIVQDDDGEARHGSSVSGRGPLGSPVRA